AAQVDADVNRLAMVPDREDSGTGSIPIVEFAQPELTPSRSAPQLIAPALPTLSTDSAFTARAPAAIKSAATVGLFDKPLSSPSKYKKKKRHLVRKTFSLLIVLGMIGGGVYALKRYVLDKKEWQADIKPLADEVSVASGLKFAAPVAVEELGAAEYSTRIVASTLGIDDTNSATMASRWRSVGVLSGALDLEAIGRSAAVDSPAFYDPTDATIYVLEDLSPELREFSLRRALSAAALDQRMHWAASIATADPSGRTAVRVRVDGWALAVAAATADPASSEALTEQTLRLAARLGPLPMSAYAAHVTGRVGIVDEPVFSRVLASVGPTAWSGTEGLPFEAMPDGIEFGAANSANSATLNAAYASSTKENAGLVFWYYALAGRIGETAAWNAAIHWLSDTTVDVTVDGRACINATIVAQDVAGAGLLLGAFSAWALAAPVESATTVGPSPTVPNAIAVTACDPGAAAATNTNGSPLSFGGSPSLKALLATGIGASVDNDTFAGCIVPQALGRNL
ncbi:unnamed protein product, partial [Phaeothamnion confervicola]